MKRIILTERHVRNILNEAITDRVWHTTSVDSVIRILDKNRLACTMSQNKSDALDNKHLFYLSTSRTKEFHSYGGGTARIELDGRKLNNKYKGGPVDYWNGLATGSGAGPQNKGTFEFEDRIVSYKPFIENATNYILRIDFLMDRKEYWLPKNMATFKKAIIKCRQMNVPAEAYDNLTDFTRQSKNTVTDKVLEAGNIQDEEYDTYVRPSAQHEMIEAISTFLYMHFDMMGEIRYNGNETIADNMPFDKVDALLNKFGAGELSDKVKQEMEKLWGRSEFGRNEKFMFTSEEGLRKVNSLSKDQDLGAAVMSLAVYILKKHGVTNGRDLFRKYRTQNDSKQNETVNEVWCILYGYNSTSSTPHLLKGDEPASRLFSADWVTGNIINAITDDQWNYEHGEQRRMTHKSNSIEQLKRYINRQLNNPNTTLLDAAKMFTSLFNGDLEHMCEILGLWIKPYKVDKEKFRKLYNYEDTTIHMSMDTMLDIKEKLYGDDYVK